MYAIRSYYAMRIVIPGARNAPRLCPAEPVKLIRIVSSGRPFEPNRRTISPLRVAQTDRWTFRIGISM